MLKRLLCLMLAVLCGISPCICLAENTEEENNQGQIYFIEPTEVAEDVPPVKSVPFIPEELTEGEQEPNKAVIGADNRSNVNPSKYPYSAICYMEINGQCGHGWTGTGFMIDKDWMLTAGHCLVCTEHDMWADSITLYFGYRSKSDYLYRYTGQWSAWTNNDLFGTGSFSANDYAYVKLYKNVGDTTGWFGTSFGMSNSEYETEWFNVAGYRAGKIKTSIGYAEAYDSNQILHYADTEPGYSGCPIFDDENFAVAINTAHFTDNSANIGRRLTTQLYYDMVDAGLPQY
ncbi:MAG: trypsin-like serine protease [Clostridia bacterium]|nr:trypsin-like serine protease [Clostridia bacterium]